jgi:hypothetical protein
MRCITRLESALLLGTLFLAACSAQVGPSNEAISRVVRDVGFPCEGAVGAEALDASNTSWRVTCANAQTYMAVVQDDGNLCVEPLPLNDSVAPITQVDAPLPRCAAM